MKKLRFSLNKNNIFGMWRDKDIEVDKTIRTMRVGRKLEEVKNYKKGL